MAKQGDLVVEIGADIAPFVDEMRKASDQARQAGASIARSFKDGYRLADPTAGSGRGDYTIAPDLGGDLERRIREGERRARANFAASLAEDRAEKAAAVTGPAKGAMLGIGGEHDGRLGGLARGITQASFAAQDFVSVLEMGGKNALNRALMSTMNNVQMLGAAFGPWGMAITAIGGALGTVLIPKLLEGKGLMDDFSDATEKAGKHFGELGTRMASIKSFEFAMGDVGSVVEEEKLRKRATEDLEIADIRAHHTALAGAAIDKAIASAVAAKNKAVAEAPFGTGMAMEWLYDKDIERMKAKKGELIEEGGRRAGDVAVAHRRLEMLGDPRFDDDVATKERQARNERQAERDRDAANRLIESTRSQIDVAQEKLLDIERLKNEGFFLGAPAGTAEKAAKQVVDGFRMKATDATNLAVSGGEARTASGFADIMKSIRQSTSSPELEVAKEQKALLERMLEKLGNGLRLDPPVQTEGI